MHRGRPPPPPWTEFLTHATENITLPQTSFAGGNYCHCNLTLPTSKSVRRSPLNNMTIYNIKRPVNSPLKRFSKYQHVKVIYDTWMLLMVALGNFIQVCLDVYIQ